MRVERIESYLRLVESILLNGYEKTLEGGPVPDHLELGADPALILPLET